MKDADLQTARLDLTPILREHAPLLFAALSDPALHEHTGGAPPATVDALAQRFTAWEARQSPDGSERWLNWMVRERPSGAAVGYVQATVVDSRADLAWVIGVRWQRRGYASEAAGAVLAWLTNQGTTTLRACIKPEHAASQAVAARLGLHRTAAWIDGEEVWVHS